MRKIMKVFLLVILTLGIPGCYAAKEPVCADFLAELNKKPPHLEYQGCKKNDTHQMYFEAEYRASGVHAASVEAYLIKTFDMPKLRFVCCGWESSNGETSNGQFHRLAGPDQYADDHVYLVTMGSVETLQKDWQKIPYFQVTVRLYPGTI